MHGAKLCGERYAQIGLRQASVASGNTRRGGFGSPGWVRKQNWDRRWQNAGLDWEIAVKATIPDITKLFRLYAQKVKRP